ncbi:N-acetylmuramoyl-L-alanine amidase [Bifidobacterium adolescentis]|uniref:N-acetylmuramoyl-L-alanine amidase n=1 Tax=Bifidobacterium adolescentis TaxID=1680 RepID=UPI0040636B08
MSDIIWKGSPNHYVGRNGYGVTHITLHIMVGYLAGTDATFASQSSRASAHYGIGATGEIHQYVSELDGSYSDANWASNNSTISIEHEGGMANGAVCTQECIDASARLCADIARRYGWTKLWHDGLKGNVWLHREIPGTDHLSCPDLAPNGLPYKQIIDKANQILEGGSMSNAGDEVWNWAYKPNGKNATPGGNMYNLLAYELPQRVRDSIMQYSYKGSAPGGNIYNTICFEIPGMLKHLTKTIETQQQQQISELSEKISKLEGTTK